MIVGLILVLVGGYYVLTKTLGMDLPALDGEKLVPVLAVMIGGVLLYRAWRDRSGPMAA